MLADLDHVASWASRNGGDAHRLMITGFAGVDASRLYAAHNPQLKAAVAWYGKLVGDKTLNSPGHPVDIATDLNAPCWDFMARKTPVFRRIAWKPCVRHCARRMPKQKSWCIPMPGMLLTRIIARAITKSPPMTAGKECWRGLRSMVGRNKC